MDCSALAAHLVLKKNPRFARRHVQDRTVETGLLGDVPARFAARNQRCIRAILNMPGPMAKLG